MSSYPLGGLVIDTFVSLLNAFVHIFDITHKSVLSLVIPQWTSPDVSVSAWLLSSLPLTPPALSAQSAPLSLTPPVLSAWLRSPLHSC